MKNWLPIVRLAIAVIFLFIVSSCASVSKDLSSARTLSTSHMGVLNQDTIASLLGTMSLPQKVAQMVMAEIQFVEPEDLAQWGLGAVLNGGGSYPFRNRSASQNDWLTLADALYKNSRSTSQGNAGIPVVWATDAVHGHNGIRGATIFPHNIGLGAANDVTLLRAIGEATAKEVRASGVNWVFAPTVAVAKDDRWGRTFESYSDRSHHVARLSQAFVEGLQGPRGQSISNNHVIATAKHFIGDGFTRGGIDQGNTIADAKALIGEHGAGYVSAIEADVGSIMASFSSWNDERVHGSSFLLREVLRDQMRFNGVLLSDWNGIGQVQGCNNEACPRAINAGIDLFMVPQDWQAFIANTVASVKNGEISEQRIDQAVLRILSLKQRAGVLQPQLPSDNPVAKLNNILGHAEHRALAREAVRKSLVLLKNNEQLLPLSASSTIVLAGKGANNVAMQSGGWSLGWQGTGNSNSDFPGATSIYAGIKAVVEKSGGKVLLSESAHTSNEAEVAIVVIGEQPYAEKEGDVTTLEHQPNEKTDLELMRAFKQRGIPVVALLLTGRPLWVNAEMNTADAFVVAWLPGTEGAGIADLLVANEDGMPGYDFTGKLSYDWPAQNINASDISKPVEDILFDYGYGLTYLDAVSIQPDLSELPLSDGIKIGTLIFDGIDRLPWLPYVGDASNWQVAVKNKRGQAAFTELETRSVSRYQLDDSIAVIWSGDGSRTSQFFWQANRAVDWSEHLDSGGDLLLTIRATSKPEGKVLQRMDCKYPCSGVIDATEAYTELPLGEWVNMAIDLRCFSQAGVDFKAVNTPFVISTDSAFSLDINRVEVAARNKDKSRQSITDCIYIVDS